MWIQTDGDSYIGSVDPDEALYAAELVFERARLVGRPIADP